MDGTADDTLPFLSGYGDGEPDGSSSGGEGSNESESTSTGKVTGKNTSKTIQKSGSQNTATGDYDTLDSETTTTVTTRATDEGNKTTTETIWTKDGAGKSTSVTQGDTDSESHEEGTHTKTFTTTGSKPEDRQTLEITRNAKGDSKTTVDHGPSTTYDILHKTVTETVWDENSSYNASHTLGSDGVSAVSGQLKAHHDRNSTETITKKGRGHDTASSDPTVERDYRLKFQDINTTIKVVHQEDDFSYEDTPYGRELKAKAETTNKTETTRKFTSSDDFRTEWTTSGAWERQRDKVRNESSHTLENTTTIRLNGADDPTITTSTTDQGNEQWYLSESYLSYSDPNYKSIDVTDHIEERKDWKSGAGVQNPYDTHTLHVWGDAGTEHDTNPAYDNVDGIAFDFLPFRSGYYDENAVWIEQDGVTYYQVENGSGNSYPTYPKTWDLSWNNQGLTQPTAQPKSEYPGAKPNPGSFTEGGANTSRLIANPEATDHFSVTGAFFGTLWDTVKLYDRDDSGRISEDLQASGYGRASATVVSILAAIGENYGAGALEDFWSGRTADNEALSWAQRVGRGALGLGQLTLEALGIKGAPGAVRGAGRKLAEIFFPKTVATNVAGTATEVGNYRLSQTVADHLTDVIKRGPYKGELARPFIKSPHLIEEIIATGKGVPDPGGVPGALRYDVPGMFRGSKGIWELVVDSTNTILHFNFQ